MDLKEEEICQYIRIRKEIHGSASLIIRIGEMKRKPN